MDFSSHPDIRALCDRVRRFVDERLIPIEASRFNYDQHDNIRADVLADLRAQARTEGLWAPQMPRERGGLGLPVTGWASFYEEANRSIFGPLCFNCAAPDDGNMSVLNKVLPTDAAKDIWLQPIIDGKVRSSFVMTEPSPGSGSDPGGMMLTRAVKAGGKYIVHGRKWFISGADGASHFILVARTSDDARRGLSAFLFHKDQPGWRILRRIPTMGPDELGGTCELEFDGLEIPEENRLLDEGDGLRLTQIRLGPARLTHCMRWLGLSRRCLEIAQAYVGGRRAFGTLLSERESVQMMLGDVAADIEKGRLLTMLAAWKLDRGEKAQKEIAMAKIHVADTLNRAADVGVQLLGARGYSKDSVMEWIYRYARCAKLVDGASEVHKMVLARSLARDGAAFWDWG
jgi:acyl-CoA dehydrogenase